MCNLSGVRPDLAEVTDFIVGYILIEGNGKQKTEHKEHRQRQEEKREENRTKY
jgi:hypothetical protein